MYNKVFSIFASVACLMLLMSATKPSAYINPNLSVENRVKDLMSQMTLEEKVAQMCQYVGLEHIKQAEKKVSKTNMKNSDAYSFYPDLSTQEIEEMVKSGLVGSFLHVLTASEANHLQRLAMQSRLRIPLLIGIDAIHGNGLVAGTTVYPSPISLSSTWCDSLVYEMSRQTAMEMRATGTQWTFTPNIDIARDPRWGRFGETCGEDTYLVSRMGTAQINGFQQGDCTGSEKVIACAKHMIGGGDAVNGTNASPTDMSERTLREVHLPPFEQTVKNVGVYTVMMAHNEINGVPSHNNYDLMMNILRKEYNLRGFVTSDWMDIERLVSHRVVENEKEASIQSVANGMDMHMHGPKFFEAVLEGVKSGRIPESRINQACSHILEAKFRLGLFENPLVDESKIKEKVFTTQHKQTALECARKGIILLKNESVLPIGKSVKKIFLTGLNADNQSILGDWAFEQPQQNVITIKNGLQQLSQKHGAELKYFNCGDNVSRAPIADKSEEAAKAAAGSDLAVVVVGENPLRYLKSATSGENVDRADLTLLNNQLDLVKRIKSTGIPTIVVFVTGRPLAEEWIEENADGIIWAWEPGCMGGQAVAEILFGEVNPSGKLTATIPRHVGQTKIYYNHKPFHYFHAPVDVKKGPLYPFGYGMSYAKYAYSNLQLSNKTIDKNGEVTVSIDVENQGDREGEEIVQLYLSDIVSQVTRPVKELKGYQRICLKAGQKKTVTFKLDTRALAYYDINMKLIAEKGMFNIMVGSSSDNKALLNTKLEMIHTEFF